MSIVDAVVIQYWTVQTEPLAVTDLEAVAKDHSSVDVSWSTNAAGTQDKYQLRYHDDTQKTAWSEVVSLTDKKQTVTDLFPGHQYTFEVTAVSHSQTSAVKTKTAVLCKSTQTWNTLYLYVCLYS